MGTKNKSELELFKLYFEADEKLIPSEHYLLGNRPDSRFNILTGFIVQWFKDFHNFSTFCTWILTVVVNNNLKFPY